MAEKTREITSNSGLHMLAKLDQRTKEAALMRQVRAELFAHVGGSPGVVARMLIERCAVLSLRVAQIDAKILAGEVLTQHDSNFALAWNNALRRTLVELGVKPATSPAPSLAEITAGIVRAREKGAAA
jgi:hypothetical protein